MSHIGGLEITEVHQNPILTDVSEVFSEPSIKPNTLKTARAVFANLCISTILRVRTLPEIALSIVQSVSVAMVNWKVYFRPRNKAVKSIGLFTKTPSLRINTARCVAFCGIPLYLLNANSVFKINQRKMPSCERYICNGRSNDANDLSWFPWATGARHEMNYTLGEI